MPRRFGQTKYQAQVNDLTGAMGPTRGAFWNSYTTTTGAPFDLGAQPLYYDPALGQYVTSNAMASGPASINIYPAGTANFSTAPKVAKKSFGAKRRRKSCKKGSRRHPKTKRCRKIRKRSNRRRRSSRRRRSRKTRKTRSRRKSKRVGRPRDHYKYKAERGCTRQYTKKYSTRSSPAYPANLCRDKVKKGNDGRMYKSRRSMRKGKAYYRWTKL